MRRVVGLFDSRPQATQVQNELIQAGVPASGIRLADKAAKQREKGFWESIADLFSMEDKDIYEEAAERGGTLVIADVEETQAEKAINIMNRHDPIDIQRKAEEWRQAGWQGGSQRSATPTATESGTSRAAETSETSQRIPVAEERLRIGKRREEHGGVRVYTEIEEVPVSGDVELREEKVRVERRAVDRPAERGDFQEQTIEATEMHEEPVVSKEARVVEEVIVSKDVGQRTEKVEDTVRRTKVRVEDLEEDFRKDYQTNFAGSGYTFDQVRAAYDYGRDLAFDERYRDRDWPAVEPEARRAFEQRNPGKWGKFGSAVHRGYDQTRMRTGTR